MQCANRESEKGAGLKGTGQRNEAHHTAASTATANAVAPPSNDQVSARRPLAPLPGGGGALPPAAGTAAGFVPAGMPSKYATQASGTLVLPYGRFWATAGQLLAAPALMGQLMGLSRVLKQVCTFKMFLRGGVQVRIGVGGVA